MRYSPIDRQNIHSIKENLQFTVVIQSLALYGREPTHLYNTPYWEDTAWLKDLSEFLAIVFEGRLGIPLTEIPFC